MAANPRPRERVLGRVPVRGRERGSPIVKALTLLDESAARRRERLRTYGVPQGGPSDRALAERHLAAVFSVIVGSRTWRTRGGASAPEVQTGSRVRTGPGFRPPRVTAETRAASKIAVARALNDLGARPSDLGGNTLDEAAELIIRSMVRSGSLRLGSSRALRDGFVGDLFESLVRRVVVSFVPKTALPRVVAAVEGSGLLTPDGRTIVGRVKSATPFLMSSTKTAPDKGFADHLIAVRLEMVDDSIWHVPLAGVEVKFLGVVRKLAPQLGQHVSRITGLPLDGALSGIDQLDRPISIPARTLLLNPKFSSFGIAPAGPWLAPGQTSRPFSTRVGSNVQVFNVYESEVSASLVTTLANALRDAALGARRSATVRPRDAIVLPPNRLK